MNLLNDGDLIEDTIFEDFFNIALTTHSRTWGAHALSTIGTVRSLKTMLKQEQFLSPGNCWKRWASAQHSFGTTAHICSKDMTNI